MKATLCALALTSVAIAGLAAEPEAVKPDAKVEKNQAEVDLLLRRYLASQRAYAALKKGFAGSFVAGKSKAAELKLSEAKKKKTLKLIRDLGSTSFRTRENASKELGSLGKEALPLFKAEKAKSKDPEIVARLESLVDALKPKFTSKGPVQLLGAAGKSVPLPWYKVERTFANAVEKNKVLHGYRFRRLTVDGSGKSLGAKRHAIVAFPAEPGKSGKKTFIALDDLRGAYWRVLATEGAKPALKSLPAKLTETGWKRVDPVPGAVKKLPRGGGRSLETNAVGSCRAYCSAQTMFHRNDWERNGVLEYAPNFGMLYATLDGNGDAINLIDKRMKNAASPKAPKHGYFFMDMKTICGKAIDWVNDYGLCAVPAKYGKTGLRTFIVCTNGTVFGKDTGGQPVFDYPANPAKAGWIIAE